MRKNVLIGYNNFRNVLAWGRLILWMAPGENIIVRDNNLSNLI